MEKLWQKEPEHSVKLQINFVALLLLDQIMYVVQQMDLFVSLKEKENILLMKNYQQIKITRGL